MPFTYRLKRLVFNFFMLAICIGIICVGILCFNQVRESVSIPNAVFDKLVRSGASLSFAGDTFDPKEVVSIDMTNCDNPKGLIPDLVCFEQLDSLRVNADCADIVSKFPHLRDACVNENISVMHATEVNPSSSVSLNELLEMCSRATRLDFLCDSSLDGIEYEFVIEPRRQSIEMYVKQVSNELGCEFEIQPSSVVFFKKR